MNQDKAKKALSKMLDSYTPGTILSFLAEIFQEEAEDARRASDEVIYKRMKRAESACIVFGCGLDSTLPQ